MKTTSIAHPFSLSGLFGLVGEATQKDYIKVGVVLMLIKYLIEAVAIYAATHRVYTPIDFVNPLLSSREYFADGSVAWLGMAWILWTLPFLWIAVALSIRRASNIGISPWFGLVILIPVVNWLGMFLMSLLPGRIPLKPDVETKSEAENLHEAFRALDMEATSDSMNMSENDDIQPKSFDGLVATIVGVLGGAVYLIAMVVLSVYVLGSYGSAMFFGAPIVTGAIAAFEYNRKSTKSIGMTLLHSMLTTTVACLAFLCFGIEGILCIAMAIPIMLPFGIFGALIGRAIAISAKTQHRDERRGLVGCMLVLPFLTTFESQWQSPPTFEVMTYVDIDAPPERVWHHVVDFPEITAQEEWFFALGIASPKRAFIEGSGVGAIRHCEFTTGEFVEPITIWNPPSQLAFDVTEQPEPMFELTPYRHLHPPHLDHSFRSTKGEFRLIDLGNQRTRLEGRTWYKLDIYPISYWSQWTDWIVHRIHLRVLHHIQNLAETSIASSRSMSNS